MIDVNELKWVNRYSDTNEHDKHGRLARQLFYKGKHVCLITFQSELPIKAFRVIDYFPSDGNDSPCYVGLCNDHIDVLKSKAEQRFIKFLNDIS